MDSNFHHNLSELISLSYPGYQSTTHLNIFESWGIKMGCPRNPKGKGGLLLVCGASMFNGVNESLSRRAMITRICSSQWISHKVHTPCKFQIIYSGDPMHNNMKCIQ